MSERTRESRRRDASGDVGEQQPWPGKRTLLARKRDECDDVMFWPGKRQRRHLAEPDPANDDNVDRSAEDVDRGAEDVDRSADAAERVLHAAEQVLHAVNGDDRVEIERATQVLGAQLERLSPGDPQALAVAAWADFALARVALLAGDRHVARSRLEAAAAAERPTAVRIEAMLALVDDSNARGDVASAVAWARKAMTLLDVDVDAEIERLAESAPSLAELLRRWRAGTD